MRLFAQLAALRGKPASENPAKSVKPKSKDKATPSKENASFLCVETLHGAPKTETSRRRQSPDYDVESDVVK